MDIIYLDNRIHTDILSCILPELDSMLLQFASATFPPQKIHTSFNGNLVTTLSLSFSLTFSSQFLLCWRKTIETQSMEYFGQEF